jgi:glycine dehydrogenase
MKTKLFDDTDFASRQIGPRSHDLHSMLEKVGVPSLDRLIEETIPLDIRLQEELNLTPPVSEHAFLQNLRSIARKNMVLKSYLGQG